MLALLAVGIGATPISIAAPQSKLLDPAVPAEGKYTVTVKGGTYDLLTFVVDFAPGAGIPKHYHGGHVLGTVLTGELTLQEKNGSRTVKAGQSFTEQPGAIHAVVNMSKTTTRIIASEPIPKGAEETTLVKIT